MLGGLQDGERRRSGRVPLPRVPHGTRGRIPGQARDVLLPQHVHAVRTSQLHRGVPDKGHVQNRGRRGACCRKPLLRMPILHLGLPVRGPHAQPEHQDGGEVHAVHPQAEEGRAARMRLHLHHRLPRGRGHERSRQQVFQVLAANEDRQYRIHPEFGNNPSVIYLVPRKGAETLCTSIGRS